MTETENDDAPRAVGKSFIWMTWAGSVAVANSVLIWMFLARMRDVDEVGRFAVPMGLYALFYNVVSLGLLPYLINEFAQRKGTADERPVSRLFSSASILLSISGVVCSLLMTATAFAISSSSDVRLSTAVLSLAMVPTALIVAFDAVSIASGRARLVAAVTTAENVLRTLIPICLVWSGYDIVVICLSFTALRFFALAVYIAVYRSRLKQPVFSLTKFRTLARACPTFAGTITLASLNWQVPLIILGYLSSEAETATFGVASRFLVPVAIVMGAYATVILPSLVAKLQREPGGFGAYFARLAAFPVVAAAVAAVGSAFVSAQVLGAFFGTNYETAAPVLNILAISTIPFCLVFTVARALIATNSQKIDLLANTVGVVVCIGAACILIPRHGALGAALAQLLSFGSIALIETAYLARKLASARQWRSASVPCAGLFIVCLFSGISSLLAV